MLAGGGGWAETWEAALVKLGLGKASLQVTSKLAQTDEKEVTIQTEWRM